MDIYASDDEKAEAIKRWWRENGATVLLAIVIGIGGVFGIRYWFTHQNIQSESAAILYEQSVVTLASGDLTVAEERVNTLMNDYSRSTYATFAAMELAAQFAADKQTESAIQYYDWAMNNARLPAQKELARVRLARLKIDQAEYDEAISILEASTDVGFTSIIAELKGDIYVQQNNASAARIAYQSAITDMRSDDPRQGLLEMKRDDVASSDAL